jgi:hypothetical protein
MYKTLSFMDIWRKKSTCNNLQVMKIQDGRIMCAS